METPTPTIQNHNFKPKIALLVILPLALFIIIALPLSKNVSFRKTLLLPTNPFTTSTHNNVTLLKNTTITTTTTNDDHHQAPPKYDDLGSNVNTSSSSSSSSVKCDIFTGEWVPNMDAPYYTNNSCDFILEHQNCMKHGRPDTDFMKWRWKPNGCELPIFNARQFLELVRDKSLAFIGDSLARNHMQSLLCLLSQVEYPFDDSDTDDYDYKRWHFHDYNFSIANFNSPYLVRHQENDPNGPTGSGLYGLFLDEVDGYWKTQIDRYDYIVLSSGHWFTRSMMYYEMHSQVGCFYCQLPNVTDYPLTYGYRKALQTAFRTFLERPNFKGIVYLRTFSPSHMEGEWNNGGDCTRQKPFKSNETALEGVSMELYSAQLEEFKVAEKLGQDHGKRFRLMDMTRPMLMRPDGHPSKYAHWPNESSYNDCVNWCLPGPIDTWNDFLLEMIRSEEVRAKEDQMVLHSIEKGVKNRQ